MKDTHRTAWAAALAIQIVHVMPAAEDPERAPAGALPGYVIERVADTSTPIPGGTGSFTSFGVPVIDGGSFAFRADGGGGQKGVYALAGGTLASVADLNTPVPGGSGNFTFFSAASIDGQVSAASDGSVAFIGQSASGKGVYTNRTGALSMMVDESFPVPRNPSGRFQNFFAIAYDGAQVAFTGLSDGFLQGLYLADGSAVSLIADQATPIPRGTGAFTDFGLSSSTGHPSMRGGDVVFTGIGDANQSGVYGWIGGVLLVVADRHTFVPTTPLLFGPFAQDSNKRAVIRDGDVAFQNDGIYVDRATGLEKVADLRTIIPGTVTRFNSFGPPALDAGKVVFGGRRLFEFPPTFVYLLRSGVFTDIQGPLQTVVARSFAPRIDGRLVKEVFSGTEALSGGRFAFKATFFGGTEGVYVARPN